MKFWAQRWMRMLDLSQLNKDQKEVVLANEKPLMVLAGAGSGKTRTLVTKIAYLIEEKGLSPFQLLALTFSNKAAQEMRNRVNSLVQEDLGTLQVTTFHAFCARTLRSEAHHLGLSRSFTIYDGAESKAVMKSVLRRQGISLKEISPYDILYFIDEIKNNAFYMGREKEGFCPDPNDYYYPFYQEYEAEMLRANAVDFGGLIVGVIQLFEKFPMVLERYQSRFKYILVDEYQDTNHAQFELVRMLSEKNQKICVVGDEDQSIYSWRGANINNILDFEDIFSNAQILKLEQNYRSTKMIIEAAGYVISRNVERKGKTMWTNNEEGEVIEVIECENEKKEARWIADQISHLRQQKGAQYRDIAVFYRINSQSRIIEDALRIDNTPYRIIGGIKFYERKEIKDLLAYMRLLVNAKDNLAFSRIINVPARGIGATSLRKLEEEAIRNNLSLFEVCRDILEKEDHYSHLRLSAKAKSSLYGLINLFQETKILDEQGTKPSILYEKILHESGYYGQLKSSRDYESLARVENLEELGNAISQYEESVPQPRIVGFLETITLDSQTQDEKVLREGGEVSLMTVHGAKGLEFPYVFVAGVEENLFPSYQSLENGVAAEEEERRLFYVAMTRAMERLYLVFAQGRMVFGHLKFNGPSRFLHEIPQKYYRWKKIYESDFDDEDESWEDNSFSQESSYEEENLVYQVPTKKSSEDKKTSPLGPKFPKGVSVVHALYGGGQVLESEGFGQEEKVIIRFHDGVKKKFMVKFAPLTLA